jgi:hypothetical protein
MRLIRRKKRKWREQRGLKRGEEEIKTISIKGGN